MSEPLGRTDCYTDAAGRVVVVIESGGERWLLRAGPADLSALAALARERVAAAFPPPLGEMLGDHVALLLADLQPGTKEV